MAHEFGLATYRFGKEDGTLIAEWALDQTDRDIQELGIGLAKLSKQHTPGNFEGEYDVEYWRDGEPLYRQMVVKKNGDIYDIEWILEQEVTNVGYGFVSGDILVAGFKK